MQGDTRNSFSSRHRYCTPGVVTVCRYVLRSIPEYVFVAAVLCCAVLCHALQCAGASPFHSLRWLGLCAALLLCSSDFCIFVVCFHLCPGQANWNTEVHRCPSHLPLAVRCLGCCMPGPHPTTRQQEYIRECAVSCSLPSLRRCLQCIAGACIVPNKHRIVVPWPLCLYR